MNQHTIEDRDCSGRYASHDSRASVGSSNCRPPDRREAAYGGSENALVPSLRSLSCERSSDDDYYGSGLTEREQFVESETRRVKVRDPSSTSVPSERSAHWSDQTESFLRRKTSWDDSNLRGPCRTKWLG